MVKDVIIKSVLNIQLKIFMPVNVQNISENKIIKIRAEYREWVIGQLLTSIQYIVTFSDCLLKILD